MSSALWDSEDTENIPLRPILGVPGDKQRHYASRAGSLVGNEQGILTIRRPIYSHQRIQQLGGGAGPANDDPPEKVDFWTRYSPKQILFTIFPFTAMLSTYPFRKSLPFDAMSGLTTGVMRIPQSMAYAYLADLPASYGLYTAFFSNIFYFPFGGSHHLVCGAQGVICLMIGSTMQRILMMQQQMGEVPVASAAAQNVTNPDELLLSVKVDIVISITLMAGLLQIFMGVFQLGFVANYLSDPLIGGFTNAACCHVVVSQVTSMFGVVLSQSYTGNFNLLLQSWDFFQVLDQTNVATLLISLFSMLLLIACRAVNDRYRRGKIPIPGELVLLTVTIGFSYFMNVHERYNVAIVGHIPLGFAPPTVPNLPKYFVDSTEVAFSVAIVSFAISYSIAKRLALLHDYEVSGNQEMFAIGVTNVGCSFFNGFAVTSSMSTSALHNTLGGKSQLANLLASAVVLLTILFLGGLFNAAPKCVLSAIILINVKSILWQFQDLKPLWKLNKYDFLLWIVTWLAVIVLDVDLGLYIGVGFSLLTVVFRTQWPHCCMLGRISGTDIYKNISLTPDAVEVAGCKIFRFEGSIYFASADHFRAMLYQQCGIFPRKIIRARQEYGRSIKSVKRALMQVIPEGEELSRRRQWQSHSSTLRTEEEVEVQEEEEEEENDDDSFNCGVHHIIVDFSLCSFMDDNGIKTLLQVLQELKEVGIVMFLANVRSNVCNYLLNPAALSLNGCRFTAKELFVSVHDAVLEALQEAQREDENHLEYNLLVDEMQNIVATQTHKRTVSMMTSYQMAGPSSGQYQSNYD